jgi:hypothetical protein
MRLRHQRFDTVDGVDAAIAPLLEYLNTRPFKSYQAAGLLRLHNLMRLPKTLFIFFFVVRFEQLTELIAQEV